MKSVLRLLMVGILLAAAAQVQARETDEPLALVAEITNQVDLYLAEDDLWVSAEVGMDVFEGDEIRTGRSSGALLLLSSGETLRVPEKSSICFSSPERDISSVLRTLLGGLWGAIARKFVDAEDAEVTSGLVGAIRGETEQGELCDHELSADQTAQLERERASLEENLDGGSTRSLLMGILYEQHRQYLSAERAYLAAIRQSPQETRLYDLLLDLYLEAGAHDKLERTRQLKNEAAAAREGG
jgi:hypothetical protein